jgi:hypothetical protein
MSLAITRPLERMRLLYAKPVEDTPHAKPVEDIQLECARSARRKRRRLPLLSARSRVACRWRCEVRGVLCRVLVCCLRDAGVAVQTVFVCRGTFRLLLCVTYGSHRVSVMLACFTRGPLADHLRSSADQSLQRPAPQQSRLTKKILTRTGAKGLERVHGRVQASARDIKRVHDVWQTMVSLAKCTRCAGCS